MVGLLRLVRHYEICDMKFDEMRTLRTHVACPFSLVAYNVV
jgi:hypothetical protein